MSTGRAGELLVRLLANPRDATALDGLRSALAVRMAALLHISPDDADVDDAAQERAFKLWEKASTGQIRLQNPAAAEWYVGKIAQTAVADIARRRNREARVFAPTPEAKEEGDFRPELRKADHRTPAPDELLVAAELEGLVDRLREEARSARSERYRPEFDGNFAMALQLVQGDSTLVVLESQGADLSSATSAVKARNALFTNQKRLRQELHRAVDRLEDSGTLGEGEASLLRSFIQGLVRCQKRRETSVSEGGRKEEGSR